MVKNQNYVALVKERVRQHVLNTGTIKIKEISFFITEKLNSVGS